MDSSIQTEKQNTQFTQIFAQVCRYLNHNDSIQMYSA